MKELERWPNNWEQVSPSSFKLYQYRIALWADGSEGGVDSFSSEELEFDFEGYALSLWLENENETPLRTKPRESTENET